jgi:hypothetical protein
MPAQKKAAEDTDTTPDPLEFSTAVHKWMDDAADQVAGFQEQVGTPTLGVDAHALSYLTRISRLLDEARSDLKRELPAEE